MYQCVHQMVDSYYTSKSVAPYSSQKKKCFKFSKSENSTKKHKFQMKVSDWGWPSPYKLVHQRITTILTAVHKSWNKIHTESRIASLLFWYAEERRNTHRCHKLDGSSSTDMPYKQPITYPVTLMPSKTVILTGWNNKQNNIGGRYHKI